MHSAKTLKPSYSWLFLFFSELVLGGFPLVFGGDLALESAEDGVVFVYFELELGRVAIDVEAALARRNRAL